MRRRRLLTAAAAVALLVAGCTGAGEGGSSGPAAPPRLEALKAIGPGEGAVRILAWPGYAEDGTTDTDVDWVTPFEKATGCQASIQVASTSDEMFHKMGSGTFDVVSASGDSSLRMIYAGKVAPVNVDLLASYADVPAWQRDQAWNSVGGVPYGMPHGWGAQLLGYRTDKVTPAPDSWSLVYDPATPYKGKISVYDTAADGIAAAAVYLMATQPDLGIKNPYALDQEQFDAAAALATDQKSLAGSYWSAHTDAQQALESGSTWLGTTWPVIINRALLGKAPVASVRPKEGSTGRADTWMVDALAAHPNCAYLWLNHVTSPDVQARAAEWSGQAPANLRACTLTVDRTHCATTRADDEAYFKKIWFWTTPQSDCLDGRTDTTCVPYSEWTKAWRTLRTA